MNPQTLAEILTVQFGYTGYTFSLNLKGLDNDEALVQPTPGGNCLNWVAGHIVGSRAGILKVLGQESPFEADKYKRYVRGSSPVTKARGTIDLTEIQADFGTTRDALEAGLASLTPERLAEKAPFSPANNESETVGSLLAGLAFHESYHTGQLGVLRRLAGKEGGLK
jgi:uncharacterized damage-inducible protein DinB